MKKIKIMFFVLGLDSGGVEKFILNYVNNMNRNLFDYSIVYSGVGSIKCKKEFEKLNFKLYYNKYVFFKNPIKYMYIVNKIIKSYKPNIIHSNLNILNGIVLFLAKLNKCNNRISHSHGLNKIPNNKIKIYIYKFLFLFSNKYSTCNLACSSLAGNYLFKKNKFVILYNAIDCESFKFNKKFRNEIRNKYNIKNEIIIGYVARFVEDKNHEFLIDVINDIKNKNIKLLFIGTGPLLIKIKEKVNILDIKDNVIFVGNTNEIYKYYNAMDLFVFPSKIEGLGMSLIEAQINGLTCIANNNIPIETKISNDIIYLDLNNFNEWKNIIKKNLSNQRKIVINDNYNIKIQSKKLEKIYKGMMYEN